VRRRPDPRPFGPGPYVLGARVRDGAPGGFPFNLPAVRALGGLPLDAPVTFLVGENGSGKSTLVEALAAALRFDVEGGTTGLEMGGRTIEREGLAAWIELEPGRHKPRQSFFLRTESFFNVARRLDEEEVFEVYGGVPLLEQSHGESFVALASNRFGGEGLYLLDEPEAALSLTSALAFVGVLDRAARAGAQFVIATHSPVLLAVPGARILELGDGVVSEVSWADSDPTRLMRAFLDAPESFLRHVLDA
jgi:predicted ATPase